MKFGLVGNGLISQRHKKAIESVGGRLVWISDPIFSSSLGVVHSVSGTKVTAESPTALMYMQVDYVIICSPTHLHRQQVQEALYYNKQVICEKPLCLPWEPLVDDDRISIVLQLRYMDNLPEKADLIRAIMVRDEAFFDSWKGDPRLAGGNIYEFFIHYIDLAILLGADFEGAVYPTGKQVRQIISNGVCIDIMAVDMQSLYDKMYRDIVANGGGVKPKDIFYLSWILNRNSELYGYRKSGLEKMVRIPKSLL